MNEVSLLYFASDEPPATGALADLTDVAILRATTTDAGDPVPAGTQGTVVGVWGNGAAYEVEFAPPIAGLATVKANDVRAVASQQS